MMELVFTKLNLQASFQSSHSGNLHFLIMIHYVVLLGHYGSLIPVAFPGTKIHSWSSFPYTTQKN